MYIWRAISEYLRDQLTLPLEFVDDIEWSERYAQLDRAEIDIA